jgi:hypothetical protein
VPPITDPATVADVRAAWEFCRHSRNIAVGNCNAAVIAIGFNQKGMRDLCFNLILASAYSVLEDVLRAYRDQGTFSSKDGRLGPLLKASKHALPWNDWSAIEAGRVDRNSSVHGRAYLDHGRCRDYIASIEKELVYWQVLEKSTPELWHW